MRPVRAGLWLVLVALVLAIAAPAFAHASLVATSPADGSHLEAAPESVTVTFDEPVEVPTGALRVFDTSRRRVDRGDAGPGGRPEEMTVSLLPDLGDGTYVATWHAVSLDGHPVQGAFVFHVGEDVGGGVDESFVESLLGSGGAVPFAAVGVVARWLTYLGALVAAGAAVMALVLPGQVSVSRLVRRAAWVTVACSLIQVPAFAAESTGLGSAALISPPALGDAALSPVGRAALVRIAGVLLVGWGAKRGLVWAGTALVVLAELLMGHTLTTQPAVLVWVTDAVHVAAAALWLGGLAVLVLTVRDTRRRDEPASAAAAVGEFSRVALWVVASLTLAGLALAVVQVRTLPALVSTPYGWTLLAKVALAAAVLALAVYNRRVLVPAVSGSPGGNAGAWRRLGTTLRWEVVGLVGVLAVTAVLGNLQPAGEAAGAVGPYSTYLDFGDGQINLVVDPNRVGLNQIHVYVLTPSGAPAQVEGDASLEFALPSAQIGPILRHPAPAGPGHWIYTGRDLAIAGQWEVTFRLSADFEEQTATATVNVR